jgi:hypothetical protein
MLYGQCAYSMFTDCSYKSLGLFALQYWGGLGSGVSLNSCARIPKD